MFILPHIAGSRCEFSIVSGLRNVNLGLTSRPLCMRNQKEVIKRGKCRGRWERECARGGRDLPQ